MESQSGEAVRESTIFAALSPRGYSRRERTPRSIGLRGSSPEDIGTIPSGLLPPVNPRDAASILRLPTQFTTPSLLSSKTPESLMMSVSITTDECWIVWKFLCDWVKTQLAMEVPASIPGFGTFYVRVQPLGIRITLFGESECPTTSVVIAFAFSSEHSRILLICVHRTEPDQRFLSKYCIQVDSEIPDPALAAILPSAMSHSETSVSTGGRNRAASQVGLGDVFAFSFVEMASCCGNSVDATRAQEWLNVVIHKLGNAMGQCDRVELSIGVGVILCIDRVIQRHLLPRASRSTSRFEYEVRTGESVVKRSLRAQAALQTTPKAKYSFLSGSTFASSIQLNPVLDRSKDVPDFSFGPPNPRPPASSFAPIGLDTRSSPRSTQLQKRYQRSASPLVNRISTPTTSPPALTQGEDMDDSMPAMPKQTADNPFPQLFDRLSRTLCVEPDQNVSCLLPSNRIGSNFTETAAFLMTEKSASQFGYQAQLSGGLVFVERPAIARTLAQSHRKEVIQDSTSEQRYFEYLSDDKLIDRCYLAPLSTDLEARVVSSAIKYIMGSSSDQIDKVLEVAHQEFVDNYYASTKKAILNYFLMRATSRERLGIPQGVPVHALLPSKWKWGSSDGPNGCIGDLQSLVIRRRGRLGNPINSRRAKISQLASRIETSSRSGAAHSKAARRKNVQSRLMSLLVLSNPQLRALRYMWHDLLTSVTLVDLPSAQGLSDAVDPIDIIEFERTQLAFSAKMKTFIMENWYNKAKMMFETAIRAETFSIHTSEAAVSFRLRHLFDTVAAVMSLQIRSLIMKSIQAYVNFFELFEEIKTENEESSSHLRVRDRPAFSGLLTTLVLRDGQIQFRDPLADIPSRLLNVLHNIPKLFYNLGRIETQFDEPLLLPNTSSPFLWNVASQEVDIVVTTIRIRSIIERNLTHLRKLQADYDVYALTHRYVNSVDCFHLEENGELESYRAEMERVQATAMQLAIDNRHSQHLGLFSVDCRYVNKKLHSDLGQWTICLLQAFEQRTGRMNAELRQQYKEIAARLAKKPLDLYELVDSEVFVQSLKSSQLQELQEKGNIIKQRLRFLLFERENMHVDNVETDSPLDPTTNVQSHENETLSTPLIGFRLSVDLLSSTAKTVKWRSHIEKLLKEAESLFVNERARIEAMFIAKRSRFQAEIEEFEGEVKGFAKKGDLRHAATYVVQLAKMQDNLYIFRQAMGTIVKEEEKLQWKPTDFSKLDDIAEEMAPYEQLWKTVRDFREMNSRWLRGNVFELPGKEGLQTLQQMLTVVANVSSVLLLNSAAAAITAETVRKQMTDFRENVRLIVAIQNPAMKERHMKAVSALIGLDFTSDEAITLLKVLEHGAFEIVNDVVHISSNATQEQQIELALNEMRDEWGATSFKLVPSKHPFSSGAVLAQFLMTDELDSEVWNFVLDKTCAESVVSLIEDHLLRLQTLSCMAHAGPFIENITVWQTFASEMGQVIEALTIIEQKWRKLIPLFAAGIIDAESKESQLFANAAQLYRSAHTTILHQPACKAYFLQTSTIQDSEATPLLPTAALISDLNQCLQLLETVKGGVRTGFETKRSSLARFYFLSDAELVTALAFASVPSDATLWKALSRCFPGIHGVQTNAASEITALLSSTGEPFPLGSPIVTADTPMPTWVAKVESSMTTILHASIRAACSDMPHKEFRKWCLIWPEQSLLAAIHYVWTLESEQAYQDPNQRKAWTAIRNDLNENLDAVSKEIRVATYPHTKATLGNVILLLTQLRDVSNNILGEVGGIWSEECLESPREICGRGQQAILPRYPPSLTWIAQPRFYFINSVLSVKVMTSSYLPYGLEYLGNGAPGLLVTPLTLRCYHAIAQAASTMIKGVCLEGAAGTGKSTICHQFARLCGRLYVTFQCANRKLSIDDLANFIKATASSGAWLCMENLQLLDATSVSIVTMLCSQVMTSLAARHAQCTLVGDKVRLRRGALFLLTLTTRHHLNTSVRCSTENGHFLHSARFFFRTIVVQSPDMEKLAEFEFQCGRFVHASNLAKLVTVALTAFERGFELLNIYADIVDEMEVLGGRLVNLRQIKRIVKRATELNNLEKEDRRRARKSILITPEADENDEVSATGDAASNDEAAEAIAKNDYEQMEYRNVSLALREHIGCVVSSANLHLVDAIIRDFNTQVLERDSHMLKSGKQLSRGNVIPSSFTPPRSLENDVENYVRANENSWTRFGVNFGLKIVQLLQTMRHHRAVVLSGEIQSGKTSLYASLSRALTQTSRETMENRSSTARDMNFGVVNSDAALIAPTRFVVVCPRALHCGQLIDLAADHQSHSVFAKLLKEAKTIFKAEKGTHTWLVFDGDLDSSWCEQILYTVEELQDDIPGYKKGLQLSSGKYLTVPEYVRIIMETTTLTNASPSFISRVGAIHVNGDRHSNDGNGWEKLYEVWKKLRKAEFGEYAEAIFATLNTIVSETVSACVNFASTNFQSYWNANHEVERVQWMLALFHSALKQSWKKYCLLASDKQRSTIVSCLFLQALVWGVGSTTDTLERQKFHLFLYGLIFRGPNNEESTLKRLVTLFFPSGTLVESLSNVAVGDKTNQVIAGGTASRKQTFYDYGFSVEFGSKWMLWTEYYNRWVQKLFGSTSSGSSSTEHAESTDYVLGSRLNSLVVPTGTTTAAICMSGQLLLAGYPAVLSGPRDCGKTICGSAWLFLSAAISRIHATTCVVPSASSSSQQESNDPAAQDADDTVSDEYTCAETIYAGFYAKASDILVHLEAGLQHIRIERQETSKRTGAVGSDTELEATVANPKTSTFSEAKRTVYVFVDDVHCFDLNQRMDSAPELLRMLAEYQSVVDPTTNLLTLCPNFLLFVTLQTPLPGPLHSPTQGHAVERLLRRFVPITLQPFSDSDLSSICESFPASVLASNEFREPLTGSTPSQRSATSTSAAAALLKEAEQLQSIIIKASLKLFRLLTSSNEFTIVQKDATFNPIKLHYNFRVGQLFQIVKTICCEIRPTLTFAEKPVLARLWCHESGRVLGDSLVEHKELFAFHRRVIDIALTNFGVEDNAFFPARFDAPARQNPTITQNWLENNLHFSFIADVSTSGNFRDGYHEINEMANVELVIERSMKAMHHTDARAPNSQETLELVLCSHVVKNVLRISRLLRMNRKAMLLLSARGRKLVTITRLACLMCKKALTVYHIPASGASQRLFGLNGACNRNEAAHCRKWNEALRAAMLKSVRTRDTSVVFIVKDAYLDPESYTYRTIDRYLAGHNLPSDVIAYEDLDEDVLSILRESAQKERNQPQASRGGNHQPVATHLQTSLVLRSKSETLSYFFQLARQNLQLVLIFSPPSTSSVDKNFSRGANWGSILWRFPNILKSCDVNYTGEWTTDALVTMAQKCLAQTSIASDKQSCTQLSEAAVQIYNIMDPNSNKRDQSVLESANGDANRSDQTWNSCVPPFVEIDVSMLVDQMALFASHYDQLENTVSVKLVRYKAGLEFIDQTSKILQTEQTQAELLLPEVIQKTDLRRRMSGSLEKEKITADKLTRGLELATTLAATQSERLATVTREYQDLIQDSRQMFDQMKGSLQVYHEALDSKDVDEIDNDDDKCDDNDENEDKGDEEGKGAETLDAKTENAESPDSVQFLDAAMVTRRRLRKQVRKFASLKRIPSSIYQLSECLGVILGIEPVEGRDEMDPDEIIKNYWKNVAVEVNTAAFWKTLMTFDVPKNVTAQMVSTLLPICTSPDFDKDLFASVHKIAGVLCEWVQKCTTFAQDFILAEPKYAQLQREQELLKEAEAQVVKRKIEIFEQSTSSRHTNELRDVSEMERQKADEKLQGTNSLLHLTNAAWKVLSSTRDKWQQKFDFYSEFATHWKGDLLLATAIVAYASCFTQSARLHLYRLWKEAITISFLAPSSSRRPLREVFSINEVDLTKMNLNGLPADDESAMENAVIALHSYHSSLLIDPYGVATDWLIKHLSSQKLVVASASNTTTNATVWREIEMSIKGETSLILTDICKERMDGLRSFIGAKRRALFDAVNHEVNGIIRSSGGYRCWCYPPVDRTDSLSPDITSVKPNTDSPLMEQPVFEFGSDACRIYFIYTDTNDLPEWLSEYLSQLTVIQFEMTAPCVETQALQKLLESQGRMRELTEIRTLQNDMLIGDEQIYGLEEELLEFFSTENAEHVYSDNSKALRIVANRSSGQTLESTKAEATAKIHKHWASLSSYVAVAKRCLDAVWAWRDFNSVVRNHDKSEKTFTLSRIWRLLVRAGETSSKTDNNLELMACFTSYLEQNVVMNLRDEDRLLFRFLLAFRIWQRRVEEATTPADNPAGCESVGPTPETSPQSCRSNGVELLGRLVALISKTDRNGDGKCKPTLKSLLTLRPTGMKSVTWSAVCYLAEASGELRQFISKMKSLENGQITWKALLEIGTLSSGDWDVAAPLDAFTRMCVVAAIHPYRFLCEVENFSGRVLQRMHTLPCSNILPAEANPPALPTVVAAAAHTATAQHPDRHHDLFYMWRSFSSSSAPLVVFCPPSIDFVDAVTNVARRAGATMDITDTIQLQVADEATFKPMLLLAMEKGQWIVLPNLQTCPERFTQLSDIYESLKDGRCHLDFRLWLSITNQSSGNPSIRQFNFDAMRIARSATQREWGSGFLSLKRSLHHTFAILKHELESFAFAYPALSSADTTDFCESEEQCLRQLGVFHALLSSRDHFPFAEWKSEGDFGDGELCAAIRSLMALRTEEGTVTKEHPVGDPKIGTWTEINLRGVISSVYTAKLESQQDQLLVRACANLVLNAWPTTVHEEKLHPTAIVAQMTIPEAVFAIDKLAVLPWVSIVSAIPHLWTSESCGPPLLKDTLASGLPHTDEISLWDPHNLRKERRRKFASQLAVIATNRGCHIPTKLVPPRAPPHMEVLPLLETIATFRKNLEGIALPHQNGEFEYGKPIQALVKHERQTLQHIQKVILGDIGWLEAVSTRDQPLDSATLQSFNDLRDNRVPACWIALLRLPGLIDDAVEGYSLERFQHVLLGRLNAFAFWSEPEDDLYKLPLDKFLDTKCVFEAVHQHFIRNYVGNALCSSDCLKVVSMFEDTPRLLLPAKEDVVFFTGVRAMGHLQLQIMDAKGNYRRASISPDGVPVVLQVTCGCLSEIVGTGSIASNISSETSTDDDTSKEAEGSSPGLIKFSCPLFRTRRGSENYSIHVMTALPLDQLVFSGAYLRIQTFD